MMVMQEPRALTWAPASTWRLQADARNERPRGLHVEASRGAAWRLHDDRVGALQIEESCGYEGGGAS